MSDLPYSDLVAYSPDLVDQLGVRSDLVADQTKSAYSLFCMKSPKMFGLNGYRVDIQGLADYLESILNKLAADCLRALYRLISLDDKRIHPVSILRS